MNSKAHLRIKYEPLTVKEPYHAETMVFNTPDEFTIYYREHEDELKNLSTLRLNKTFKIPGYRITVTKRGSENQELMLKKDYYGVKSNEPLTESSKQTTDNNDIAKRLSIIEQRIDNIERFLQQLQ